MKLRVVFNCQLVMSEFRKSYSGQITLFQGSRKRTLHFLMLNPYGGTEAEFSIYTDEAKTNPLVEGVGEASVRDNPETGLPVTNFDFGITANSPNVGLIFVAAAIISEAIYHLELVFQQKTAGLGTTVHFNHVWEQQFAENGVHIARDFIENFDKV